MAQPVYYTGDTWPPLTGTAKDSTGAAVDLSGSDSLRVVSKGSTGTPPTVIAGAGAFCTSPFGGLGTGVDGKWMYTWGATDLSVADTYTPELEVTWDAAATPPQIETFRLDSETFLVKPDND